MDNQQDILYSTWNSAECYVATWMGQWRRQWHPTPVLLPGESHGWRSLVGCRLWGRTESDTTEVDLAAAEQQRDQSSRSSTLSIRLKD